MKLKNFAMTLLLLAVAGAMYGQGKAPSRSARSTTTTVSTPTTRTSAVPDGTGGLSATSKSAMQLVEYPLGVLVKDGRGLTLKKAVKTVKNDYPSWEVTEREGSFNVWQSDGYNISWRGVPLFLGQFDVNDKLKWHYSINFMTDMYTKEKAMECAMRFINELRNEGFSMTSDVLDGRDNYPIDKILTRGNYRVVCTLICNGGSWHQFDIDVWPNWD